jgi:ABC-type branched-subunit amino acid transport system substrate-binding protein
MRLPIYFIVGVAALTSLFNPSILLSEPPKPETLKVGILSGLSGAAAKWNRFQNMGIELAKEEINSTGEVKIEIVYQDSQTNATRAITAFDKLVELDKVSLVIANDFGFVVAPLIAKSDNKKLPLIAISLPHSRYCDQSSGYLFSISSQFSRTRESFDHFFDLNPTAKSLALVAFDDPEWGHTYLKVWREIAERIGLQIVDTFLSAELVPDFRSALTKMFAKKPDVLFVAHEPESFTKTAIQLGYKGKIVFANNVLEMLADAPSGRGELDGIYTVDPKISPEFREKFRARFHVEPILEAYAGYEAMQTAYKGWQSNRSDIARGIRTVKYQGVAGQIDFTGTSCVGNFAQWGLYRFENIDGTQQMVLQ